MKKSNGRRNRVNLLGIGVGILLLCLASVLLAGSGVYGKNKNQEKNQEKQQEAVEVYYIHNNPCESCREFLHFKQDLNTKISGEIPASAYKTIELNILLESSKSTYEQLMKKLEIPVKDRTTPMVVVGKQYLTGKENLEENTKNLLLEELGVESAGDKEWKFQAEAEQKSETGQLPGVSLKDSDSYLLYFSTTACESCESAGKLIDGLPKNLTLLMDGKEIDSRLVVEERNITKDGNLSLYQQVLKEWNIPEKDRVVPLIVFQGGYLSGKEAILAGLEKALAGGKALDFTRKVTTTNEQAEGLTLKDIPKILGAGLAGGLNPCSFSMLLLLLSLIAARSENTLKLGIIYLSSKFTAYFIIAIGFYAVFSLLESSVFASVQEVIRLLLIGAAILFAVLNFHDFLKARNSQYGKMLLKLPKKLQAADRNLMQSFLQDNKKPLWISVFLLGFLISAGEFLCTGQVYLATLLTMNYVDAGKSVFSYVMILVYILMMMLPSLIIVLLVNKGKRLHAVSDYIVNHTGLIKLINVLLFVSLGIILLLFKV